MEIAAWFWGIGLGLTLFASVGLSQSSELYEVDPHILAGQWEREHISPSNPNSLRHTELNQLLNSLARQFPNTVEVQPGGHSLEGREICLVRLGSGGIRILLWSQMHGDEPTATSALLDLIHFVAKHRAEPWVESILQKYTLLCLPMLNPDGAERNQRRNSQQLDINRDARMLQTQEGRILKEIRDRFKPILGFNLHNQNSLTTVGDTGRVATIALLAVAWDQMASTLRPVSGEADSGKPTVAPVIPISKQVCAVLYEALSPFVYEHISRYDEAYNPRAFGDNFALWGTPVVLIETGGLPAGEPAALGVKLNFVGLLAVLNSLATGRIGKANPAVYDALKINSEIPIFDLILRNAQIFAGTGIPSFRGDIAVRRDIRTGGKDDSIIADIGDLGTFTAHQTIDCTGALVTPGLIVYDPRTLSLASRPADDEYMRAGATTVLEAATWERLTGKERDLDEWKKARRRINWAFVVTGDPPTPGPTDSMHLSAWLAAGGRAWIRSGTVTSVPDISSVPGWFGVEVLSADEAAKFTLPRDPYATPPPEPTLRELTSEAANRFHLSGRGIIKIGAVADLVIWRPSVPCEPLVTCNCRPAQIILNGHLVDLGQDSSSTYGRFLGR